MRLNEKGKLAERRKRKAMSPLGLSGIHKKEAVVMSKRFLSCAGLFIFSVFLFLPTILHAEIFFQDDFESGNLSKWRIFEDPGDGCDSTNQIAATTEDKFSGLYSAKFTLPSGDMCTYMNSPLSRRVGQGDSIYFRFRLKYAPNREWNWGNGDKVAEILGDDSRNMGARVIFNLERRYLDDTPVVPDPSDPHMAKPVITVVAANDGSWRPCNDPTGRYFCQNIDVGNPAYITAGQWYTIELYIKVDAYGAGQLKVWIDGRQIIDINNIYTIRNAATQAFTTVVLGGTLNQPGYVFPIATASYWDDVVVSDTCNSCDQLAPPANLGVL